MFHEEINTNESEILQRRGEGPRPGAGPGRPGRPGWGPGPFFPPVVPLPLPLPVPVPGAPVPYPVPYPVEGQTSCPPGYYLTPLPQGGYACTPITY